jgi:hypothetical protein
MRKARHEIPTPTVQEIEAAHRTFEEGEPPLSFRVGKGWSTSPPEVSDSLKITWGETAGIRFVSAQEVYKPTTTSTPVVVDLLAPLERWG